MDQETNGSGNTNILRFRTGAAMPARLGSEQLKDEITAVIELVKNAYDADATEVRLEFREIQDGQRIVIQDNGTGMTLEDMRSKWMWLATENKVREDRSNIFRRRRLGQKGVGRFAAQKLGHQLTLRTRTAGESNVLQVKFNWDELDNQRELSDYEYPVKHKKADPLEPVHGTRLELRPLRIHWTKARVERLRNQLAHLIDPETAATDFKIYFVTPWQELNGQLENPLPGNETHRIEFELTREGNETRLIFRHGSKEKKIAHLTAPLVFGPLRGTLRYFGQGLAQAQRARGGDEDADWNVGVRLFRDGCRVRPYGEPGAEGDWLQIYRTRYLKGSRFRLKPHYLQGTVHISKEHNPTLHDTTSREGLETNDSYFALIEFVKEKVGELSDLVREEEVKDERSRLQERYKRALEPLTAGLNHVHSDQYRGAVESADRNIRSKLLTDPFTVIRNAHWECLDCGDSWKAPRNMLATHCREFSVGRDGHPSNKPGCGSTNIQRKENVHRNEPTPSSSSLEDVMTGAPAYVSGMQLKPLIDWEMGENDEESEVREERRELAINGRYPAFRMADSLDGNATSEGTALEALRGVAALTVHVINAASYAWGRWHCKRAKGEFQIYLAKWAELKSACLSSIAALSSDQSMTLSATE